MRRKKILTDPTFWVLIILNGYLLYRFYEQPELFMTLVWLYWSQSMLLGVFTILDLLTIKNAKPVTLTINKAFNSMRDDKKSKYSSVRFFFIIYGALHLFYSAFLLTMNKDHAPIRWEFFKYFFYAFLVGQVINFIQNKIQQRKQETDTAPIMFSPFIRVLPVHLIIIFSGFFPGRAMIAFLILKSVADVVTYVATKPAYKSRETDATLLTTQQNQTMGM
jgi:hypothetical protein